MFGLSLLVGASMSLGQKGPWMMKADCLIFVLKDCPIANQYMPEIGRLVKKYQPEGVQFQLVFDDPDITSAATVKYRTDYSFKGPIMLDKDHWLAKKLGASISPTAVVRFMNKVYYVGRIDDTYAALGKRRSVSKHHDLRDALDAVLADKAVKTPTTQAVGCRLY